MYYRAYTSVKQKSFRWNTCVKVTAHSVETHWSQRQTVGISSQTSWASSQLVSVLAILRSHVHFIIAKKEDVRFHLRNKVKRKNKAKRWNRRRIVSQQQLLNFRSHQIAAKIVETNWKSEKLVSHTLEVGFSVQRQVSQSGKIEYQVFSNPCVRSLKWNNKELVLKSQVSSYASFIQVRQTLNASWEVKHFGISANTSWKQDGKLVLNVPIISNTRKVVGRCLASSWNVKIGVYSIKSIRYKIKQGMKFMVPDRSLPIFAFNPHAAVVPSITWNRLPQKRKSKIK